MRRVRVCVCDSSFPGRLRFISTLHTYVDGIVLCGGAQKSVQNAGARVQRSLGVVTARRRSIMESWHGQKTTKFLFKSLNLKSECMRKS